MPKEQSATTTQPKRRRWRKKTAVALACLIVVAAVALFGFLSWLRSEKFNSYVANEIKKKLVEFGLRGEIGSFGFAWDAETARLKDFKVYNQQTGQLIATVKDIEVKTKIIDLYALKLSREVVISNLNLDGAEVFIEIDEQGRSNLVGIHEAPSKSQTLKFDTSKLLTALTNSAVHYKDRQRNIEADLNGLQFKAQPDAQQAQLFNLQLDTESGRVLIENRESKLSKLSLTAKASATGVEVEQLQLNSDLGDVTAKGKVVDFKTIRYSFDIESNVKLEQLANFAFPQLPLHGQVTANGKLEGEGEKYKFNGSASAPDLLVGNTKLCGIQLPQIPADGDSKNLKLNISRANVQSVTLDNVVVSGISAGTINGEIKLNGKDTESKFNAPTATVAAVSWSDSKLSNLKLNNVATRVQGSKYDVTAAASLPGGTISGIEFGNASA